MAETVEQGAGLRVTRQRRAIAEALERADDFHSAQDIHDLLRHAGVELVKRDFLGPRER